MSQLGLAGPNSQELYSEIIFRTRMNGFTNPSVGSITMAAASINVATGTGISNSTNKPIASHIRIDWPMKIKGLVLPKTTSLATGEVAFNVGIWTVAVDGSNNWSPSALYATGLQGELIVGVAGAANLMTHFLTFASTVVVPPGDYFIAGCYRCNGTTAGVFSTANLGMKAKAIPPGIGRYDLTSSGLGDAVTNTVTYTNATIASLFTGISWVDATNTTASVASINWGLWCEQ